MISIEKLMMISMEDVNEEEVRLTKMWEENMEAKNDMEIYLDLSDSDNWLVYEELIYNIDYIEKNLEIIEDYKDNYNYYWDMI